MNMNDRWSVRLDMIEIDGQTHAEARLAMTGEDELVGRGEARRNLAGHGLAAHSRPQAGLPGVCRVTKDPAPAHLAGAA